MLTTIIRHVGFEDLGLWEAPLVQRGPLRYLQAGVDDLSTCTREPPDLLVVLGGPLGVYETDQYPFIEEELRLIRDRLDRGKPLLGICLGAQLIAAAADARVYPSGVKEIGWGPITLTQAGRSSCLQHLSSTGHTVLHWHGDTFDLPNGATLLASTDLVENQAFSIGAQVLGLQFHVEADPRMIETWLIGHTCELGHAGIKPADLRRVARALPPTLAENSQRVLTSWLTQLKM